MDFKKLKKSSSKKLLKGGLGFFLSPREDTKEEESSNAKRDEPLLPTKRDSWDNEVLKIDQNTDLSSQGKDYIDDIPIIPSLDDFAEDDIINQIAKAPLAGVKKIASYKELENELLKNSAFANLEEVNLHVFIKLLHPESCLDEPDTPWTKEGLFNELVSIVNERNL